MRAMHSLAVIIQVLGPGFQGLRGQNSFQKIQAAALVAPEHDHWSAGRAPASAW